MGAWSITGEPRYDFPLLIALSIVLVTVVAAAFVQTPYGRFADARFGISIDPRLGWFLMELPASVAFGITYFLGPNRFEPFPLLVLFVWSCHYLNRGFLMPLFMRVPAGQRSGFGLMVVMIGWVVLDTVASGIVIQTKGEWLTIITAVMALSPLLERLRALAEKVLIKKEGVTAINMSKVMAVVISVVLLFFVDLIALASFASRDLIGWNTGVQGLFLAPAVILGGLAGGRLFPLAGERFYRRLALGLLVCVAIVSLLL